MGIEDWLRLNRLIDVKGNDNLWKVCSVTKLDNSNLEATFDGWGSFSSVFALPSSRIAPFRKFTSKYTGPPNSTKRIWAYSEKKVQSCMKKLKKHLNKTLPCKSAYETTQFYRGDLFILIENLINYDYTEIPDQLELVVDFFTTTIDLIIKYLKEFPSLLSHYYKNLENPEAFLNDKQVALSCAWPEIMDSLNKLLAVEPRCRKFFETYHNHPETYKFSEKTIRKEGYSGTFLYLLDYFVQNDGLILINNIIKSNTGGSQVPIPFLTAFSVYNLSSFMHPDYLRIIKSKLRRALYKRIMTVNERDIKFIDPEVIINLIEVHDEADLKRELQINLFVLYCKMIRSGFLEKRIKGVNEVASYIENSEMLMTQEAALQILIEQKVLEDILEERVHEEILKRCIPICKLYAKFQYLTEAHCNILWQFSQDKQKSISDSGYLLITEISAYLDESKWHSFFNFLISFSDSEINLQVLTDFFLKSLEKRSNLPNTFEEILLRNIEDNSNSVRMKESITCLQKIYCCPQYHKQRIDFINRLSLKLQKHHSIPQYIYISIEILKILEVPDFISICNKIKLKNSVLKNLDAYIHFSKKKQTELNSATYLVKYSHIEQIKSRLMLLELIFNKSSFELSLGKKEFKILWEGFITDALTLGDSLIFLKSINTGIGYGSLINNQSQTFKKYFLNSKRFDPSKIQLTSFKAFRTFFFKCNSPNSIWVENEKFVYTNSSEILGFNELVKIYLKGHEKVANSAGKLLKNLMIKYNIEASVQVNEIFHTNIKDILKCINENRENWSRGIELLTLLLDLEIPDYTVSRFNLWTGSIYLEIILPTNLTVRNLRKKVAEIIKTDLSEICVKLGDKFFTHLNDDKKLKIPNGSIVIASQLNYKMIELQDTGRILANEPNLIHLVFEEMLAKEPYTEKAWDLVSKLQLQSNLEDELRTLQKDLDEIFPKSPFKFLHCLCHVRNYAQNNEWLNRFLEKGARLYINKQYKRIKQKSLELIPKQEEILIDVLSIVDIDKDRIEILVESLINTMIRIAPMPERLGSNSRFTQLLAGILEKCSTLNTKFFNDYCNKNVSSLVQNLMDIIIKSTSHNSYTANLIKILIMLLDSSSQHNIILTCLVNQKRRALTESKTKPYWKFLLYLLKHPKSEVEKFDQLNSNIFINDIQAFFENSASDFNVALWGVLSASSALISRGRHFSVNLSENLIELLHGGNNPLQYPRCKTLQTRKAAYDFILSILTRSSPETVNSFSYHLELTFHLHNLWRSNKPANWSLQTINQEKSQYNFVGLRNLGCICYMNSLFQQLFSIKSFSNSIVSVNWDEHELLLQSLKSIFSLLEFGHMPYISPKKFCRNFTDLEGRPVNVYEQMDADEFFSRLMERIENSVKGIAYKSLVQDHFGGVQAVEMISKSCEHRNERAEYMLSIPLEVKNKSGLIESLRSLVDGEVLQGDNAYFCETCKKKVTALMRTSVKYLPNFLVFALRRFEFNYDTMNRRKLDDLFEFPFDLDMKEFTTEYLNNTEVKEDEYYQYFLRGIVIHHGRAEQGHYYSYIKHDEKWFEFNDTLIKSISFEELKEKSFGATGQSGAIPTAYLLMYERISKFEHKTANPLSFFIPNRCDYLDTSYINRKNLQFWVKKNALSPDYINFIINSMHSKIFTVPFYTKFFLTILIRLDKYSSEKIQMLKYISDNIDQDSACIIMDTIASENGAKEFLLYCPNNVSRKLIVILVKLLIDRFNESSLMNYMKKYIRMLKYVNREAQSSYGNYIEILGCFMEKFQDYTKENSLINTILSLTLGYSVNIPLSQENEDNNHLVYTSYKLVQAKSFDYYGNTPLYLLKLLQRLLPLFSPEIREYLISQQGYEAILALLDMISSFRAFASFYAMIFFDNIEASTNFCYYLLSKCHESQPEVKAKYFTILAIFIKRHTKKKAIFQMTIETLIHFFLESGDFELSIMLSTLFKILKSFDPQDVNEYLTEELTSKIEVVIKEKMYCKVGDAVCENPTFIKFNDKLQRFKSMGTVSEIDSDEELPLEYLAPESSVFVYDSSRKSWLNGTVKDSIQNELILVDAKYNNSSITLLKDINYNEVLPRY